MKNFRCFDAIKVSLKPQQKFFGDDLELFFM